MSICLFAYELHLSNIHKELKYDEIISKNFNSIKLYKIEDRLALGCVDNDESARNEVYNYFKEILTLRCEGITDIEISCYIFPICDKLIICNDCSKIEYNKIPDFIIENSSIINRCKEKCKNC